MDKQTHGTPSHEAVPASDGRGRILLPSCPTEPRDAAVAEKLSLYVFRQLVPILRALRDAAEGTEAGEA